MPAAVGMETATRTTAVAAFPQGVAGPLQSPEVGSNGVGGHGVGSDDCVGSVAIVLRRLHLDVEVQKNPQSTSPPEPIRDAVASLIASMHSLSFETQPQVVLRPANFGRENPFLSAHVTKVLIPDLDVHRALAGDPIDVRGAVHNIHVFTLCEADHENEQLEGGDEDLAAASHIMLPNVEFDGLWESLLYDSSIKSELLNYASTALSFSEAGVDGNLVACNRVVLLHGPPGTGKTSLCKALAQKLAIQFSGKYSTGQLMEINSHSLFSKWFSESGKLVMKMFQNIEEIVDDPESLVFLLIDEVESLTAARKAAASGNEPSDAIRVVNALLTQIDRIKRRPNVFILTTSNLTGAIDLAFVDRADIKQYIGPPTRDAVAAIYESSVGELMARGLIIPPSGGRDAAATAADASQLRTSLSRVANESLGLSGRTLRKLPFIAFALFIPAGTKPTLDQLLVALDRAVQRQREERSHIPD